MICTLTIGAVTIDLAGGEGRTSETSGLTISGQHNFQQVAYVGTAEARQFFRPGSLTAVSFESTLTFDTVADAEFFMLSLPGDLKNQTSATALLGTQTADGTAQVETATIATAPTGAGNAIITVTAANVTGSPIALTVPLLGTENENQTAAKVVAAINANAEIRKRFIATHGSPDVNLTAKRAAANDSTLNIAIANGSPSPGLTPAATSANATAGVAPTYTNTLALYDVAAQVSTRSRGASVTLSVTLTGRVTAP
jgi:hypothetical protein